MALGKITRNRQVTIPKGIFEELNLKEGEYVEFSRDGDQIVLRPKTVMDREQDEAKKKLFALIDRIQERNKDVDPEVVEREVQKAIAAVRRKKKAK